MKKKELNKNTSLRTQVLLSAAIILVTGIIIYSNSFDCSFHFDDYDHIVDNPKVHDINDVEAWWHYSKHRPLSMMTFVINYHFHQADVYYYHVVNLSIHIINSLLVFWLVYLLLSTPVTESYKLSKNKLLFSFTVAMFFVSHPLATQSVTYIIQRQAAMASLFYLLALCIYLYLRINNKTLIQNILGYSLVFISFVIAVLSKENAYTLPVIIVLLEIFFFRKERFVTLFKNYKTYLVLGSLLVAFVVVFNRFGLAIFNSIPPSAASGTSVEITPINYLLTQFSVIAKYILMLFVPIGQNLDHSYPVSLSFFEPLTILSFVFLSLILAFSIFIFKKNRLISFAIIWFFVTLSIESSIVPINDVIFEHRTYLPSVGFFIAVLAGLYALLWDKNRKILLVFSFLPILIFSYMTYQRNKVWKTDFSLWSDVIKKSPEKPRAYLNRGMVYNSVGELELAFADYSKARELDSTFSEAWLNCGTIYGSWDKNDSALICFSRAVQINPNFKLARWNRGVIHGLLGNWEKAILDYDKVIELDKTFANVFYNRGVAFSNLSKWDMALKDFLKTVELNPQYPNAYFNCAVAYDNLGDMILAEEYYTKAILSNPNDIKIYFGRAVARMHNQKWQEALQDFTFVLQKNPNYPNAKTYYNLVISQIEQK